MRCVLIDLQDQVEQEWEKKKTFLGCEFMACPLPVLSGWARALDFSGGSGSYTWMAGSERSFFSVVRGEGEGLRWTKAGMGRKEQKGCTKESEGRGGCDDGDKCMMYYEVLSKLLSICLLHSLSTIGQNKWASSTSASGTLPPFVIITHHLPSSLPLPIIITDVVAIFCGHYHQTQHIWRHTSQESWQRNGLEMWCHLIWYPSKCRFNLPSSEKPPPAYTIFFGGRRLNGVSREKKATLLIHAMSHQYQGRIETSIRPPVLRQG